MTSGAIKYKCQFESSDDSGCYKVGLIGGRTPTDVL